MKINCFIFFLCGVIYCAYGMNSNGMDATARKASCMTCEELEEPTGSGAISRHQSFEHEKISASTAEPSAVLGPEEKKIIPTICPLCHESIDTYETAISSDEICKTCAEAPTYFHIDCALRRLIVPCKTTLSKFFDKHDLYHEIKLDNVIKKLRARGALVDWPAVHELFMQEYDCTIDPRIKRRLRAKLQELAAGFTEV